MSGAGSPDLDVDGSGLRVAVVAAQWHQVVMDGLVAGALRGLAECGVEEPLLLRVPGSFELPVAAARLARSGFDAVVALGVVIRGGTPHFEYVCAAATDGLSRVAVDTGVPVAERVPLTPHPNDHNLAYLRTKRDRMGHDLPHLTANGDL